MSPSGTFKKVCYTGPVLADPRQTHPIQYLCRNLQEEQNLAMTHKLQERVRLLRSLSIEIGAEVRYQNRLLGDLGGAEDRAEGALHKAAARVSRLVSGPQYYYFVSIFLFSLACFVVLWCIIRFR